MAEEPTRLTLPSPDARVARSPFGGKNDPFGVGGLGAVGTLSLVPNILNGETVTIDGKLYTWNTVLGVGDGDLIIGINGDASLDALVAAINLDPAQAGILYAAATTIHPTVSATDEIGSTMEVTAKFTGSAGDAITTVDGIADAGSVWTGATLSGGVDPDAAIQFVPIVQWGQMRVRVRLDGADGGLTLQFARPARNKVASTGLAEIYTVDQPAVVGPTALVDGVEQSLEITAAEHIGENWLKMSVDSEASNAVIGILDISGELLGLYH
jgi:hypothetical protein